MSALGFLVCALAAGLPAAAAAQPAAPVDRQVSDAQAEIARLRQELDALKAQYDAQLQALEERLTALAAAAAAAAAPSGAPVAGTKIFNPDIAVIGNMLGAAGRNPQSDQPALGVEEVEASFQAIVDPYARADFFLSASPEGLAVEEGYVTFNTLPGGLLLKAGKMRPQFGKVNTMHEHVLPWTDRPLVTRNLLGGAEGFAESGLSVSRLINNASVFIEATGEAYYGASELFRSSRRSRLVYLGRLRAYRDLTEGTNLDLGGSFAFGPSAGPGVALPEADFSTRLIGVDATFRYRPLRRAIYRRFVARTELVWSQPREGGRPGESAFGFFGSGDYQFARRWYVGARYDRAAQAWDPAVVDRGGSLYLTFWPSEFNQVRAQYRHTSYGSGVRANEFLFQFLFSIGAHGAHVF